MNPKQQAALASLEYVSSGMTVGLGTGSTADFFLIALSEALASGRLSNIVGVPTSLQSEKRAKELNIPLTTLEKAGRCDVTVDGADEVDPQLDLIKGLGGALLREKIVAQNTETLIIIADASKRVNILGARSPLPVEVAAFSHEAHVSFLKSVGATPVLRMKSDGAVFITDNSNVIYDCRFKEIPAPVELQAKLKERAGIIETGLFPGMAKVAIIANGDSISTMKRGSEKV
jgi:ribose 5-phosphate isomerase A